MKGSIDIRHGRWYVIETGAGEVCVQCSGEEMPRNGHTLAEVAEQIAGSAEAAANLYAIKIESGWCFKVRKEDWTETCWHGPHQTRNAAQSEAEAICKILGVEVEA